MCGSIGDNFERVRWNRWTYECSLGEDRIQYPLEMILNVLHKKGQYCARWQNSVGTAVSAACSKGRRRRQGECDAGTLKVVMVRQARRGSVRSGRGWAETGTFFLD